MKKILFTAALLLALAAASLAQQVALEGINTNQAGPLLADGRLAGFYSLKEKRKGKELDLFTIKMLDGQMQEASQFDFEMPLNSEQVGGAFSGSRWLFVFYNRERQFLKYLTVSASGADVKERSVEKAGIWPEGSESFFSQVFPADSGGFYLVQPVRKGKTGYRVEKVGGDLATVWEKTFVPEKGAAVFVSGKGSPGELVFVELRQRPLQERKLHFELVALEGQTGEKRFSQPLHSDELLLFPTGQILVEANQIVLAGMFFKGKKVKDKNSDGLFASTFDLAGKPLQQRLHEWEAMEDAFKPYKKFLAKKPKVMVHAVVRDGADLLVVGEIFQREHAPEAKALGKAGVVKKDEGMQGDGAGKISLLDFAAFKIGGSDLAMREVLFCEKEERVIYQTDYQLVDLDNDDFALALQAAGKTPAVGGSEGGEQVFSFLSLDKTAAGEPVIYFYNQENRGLPKFYLGTATLKSSGFEVKKYWYENLLGVVTGGKWTAYLPLREGRVLKNEVTGKRKTWELTQQ